MSIVVQEQLTGTMAFNREVTFHIECIYINTMNPHVIVLQNLSSYVETRSHDIKL